MLMLWAEVVPFIATELSVELTVKAPELAVTAAEATVVFAERVTPLGADTALVRLMLAPLEVIEALPPEEVIVPEVGFVIWPEPDNVTFPEALRAPVGATVVPPLIEIDPLVAVRDPAPEYVPEGLMSMLPVDTTPARLRLPPVTVSAPVAEIAGSKVMFVVVVFLPIVIALGDAGNRNFSNFKFALVWAILKLAVDWITPDERSAGRIEKLPVVPTSTPAIVVALFQTESALIVTFELELEKSKVPEEVVIDAPPVAKDVGNQPPNRTALLTLVFRPKPTPFEAVLEELSPLKVIGPLFAKMSMKLKYSPSPVELEVLPEPIPVMVIPPPAAVARICVPW